MFCGACSAGMIPVSESHRGPEAQSTESVSSHSGKLNSRNMRYALEGLNASEGTCTVIRTTAYTVTGGNSHLPFCGRHFCACLFVFRFCMHFSFYPNIRSRMLFGDLPSSHFQPTIITTSSQNANHQPRDVYCFRKVNEVNQN